MTTVKNVLHSYTNGNYKVTLFDDGTKVRESDGDSFIPSFPESIDVKITNSCDLGCPYCHEESIVDGVHCDMDELVEKLEGLPRGVELALGGGNPLTHPDLFITLHKLSKMGFVCNITVNGRHLNDNTRSLLQMCVDHKWLHGVGVSWDGSSKFMYNAAVAHVIAGVHSFAEIEAAHAHYDKLLILGYKTHGRGVTFHSDGVVERIADLKNNLWRLFKTGVVSFDNLAITQLEVKKHLSDAQWSEFYMGDDGGFTMFYDAVEGAFASSSISKRVVSDDSILTYFQKYQADSCSKT